MGGPFSGRNEYATTPTVEECLTLDVNEFTELIDTATESGEDVGGRCSWGSGEETQEILFTLSPLDGEGGRRCELTLFYETYNRRTDERREHEYTVPLTFTDCNFGGARPWFRCPRCHSRVGKLYEPPGETRFRCRECYNLAYQSSRVSGDAIETAVRRYKRVHEKIDGERPHPNDIMAAFPERPNGMHEQTYESLLDELDAARREYDDAQTDLFRKLAERVHS